VITFAEFERQKTRAAAEAPIHPLTTTDTGPTRAHLRGIGNDWTRTFYDGDFRLFDAPADRPAISLVFVQSRDGNTGAANPAGLGGGPTDTHLLYEGLSRVAADAVLAGAGSAAGRTAFFSVWHPELTALRKQLGLPRHPAQVIVSQDGRVDADRTLLFNVPDVPVFVLAGSQCRDRCRSHFEQRPWVTVIPLESGGLTDALTRLRCEHGITRISAIGGRTTATSLIDAGLVQDLCLTTAPRDGGEPHTPFYIGTHPPSFELIVRKRERDQAEPIIFEHKGTTARRPGAVEGGPGATAAGPATWA
jgi:riboflavin biosynthesis pyrimidine reductase